MTATIGKPYSKYKDYAESYHVAGTRPEDSQWRGKLAEALGYSGSIHQVGYDLASEGKNSYGRQLRKYQKNSRPAICDLTLNAPKSLSVEALVHSNPVAVAAHDRGVENAIRFTEQHLLFSQIKRQGQVERVHTDRALIGSFRQRDNREGEPHLHTHNVIFNVGYVEGKWRSLANEQVYLNKLTIGAIYQNDTAYHLHQAGYQTYWDANGQFELAGNPKRLLEQTFAQRTEKLEAYLADLGLDRTTATPEQLNAANRATRNQKAYDKDAQSQLSDWQSTAATAGIAPCQKMSQQELESLFQAAAHPVSPQEIVLAAAERLSEKRSSFGYMELVKEGCRLSAGRYLSNEIINTIQHSQELIAVSPNTPYLNYTTRTILQRESQILESAIQGKSVYARICEIKSATVAAQKFMLNAEQTKALQHIATSQDLITLIQGSAGVGKTHSLSALKDLMGERPIIGCAVGGLQAEALEADSGIPSQTLESLIRIPKAEFPKDTLIVVDEAGVVSNRQMHDLIERVKSSDCRLLLVGDTKQLSAVEQGNPFRLLQTRAGLETAYISQNMRQSDEQLKAVVDLCEAQRPAKAFDLLEKQGKIREIPDADQLNQAIVDDYLTRPVEQRRNTLIMATTHKERAILTGAIRSKLIEQGELSGPALSIEVLQKKDLDKHHLILADHYQVGDLVRFWRNSATFTKGELYRVTATNPEKHSIELVDTLGQTKTLDLHRYRERLVFSPQRISIAAGEEMRFTAGIKDKNGKQLQVNGQRFRIEAIDPVSQTIEISTKGKQFTVTPQDLLHSDYRWISTVHSLQGATAQYAIFAAGQGNGALLSKESWYVAASRAKLEFTVYCSDSAQLRESIQDSIAQRPAIDLIHPSIPTSTQQQATEAIVDYAQQQAFNDASIPQALSKLTERLRALSSVTKTAQLQDHIALTPEPEQDTQQITQPQQLLLAISNYVEAQALEASPLGQNLEALVAQLSQLQIQKVIETIQQLSTAISSAPVPAQTSVIGSQMAAQKADQLLKVIADSVEVTATEAALIQPLATLIEELHTLLAQGINSKQNNNQSQSAISNYIAQETVESEILPALENLITHLNTLLPGKPLPLISAAQNENISNQALSSVTNYLALAAIESEITEAVFELTKQLTPHQYEASTSREQLDSVISNFLAETRRQFLLAMPNYIKQSTVDPALNSPTNEVIAPTPPPLSPELLAAQFQILSDQLLAHDAVYQEQGLRIERSDGQIIAKREGNPIDLQKPENLVSIVNHLQALLQEFELNSLYQEFIEAARLEKSIQHQANKIVKLNSGNYHDLGLSVEITGSFIEIQLNQNSVFQSNQGKVSRPDDLLQLSNLRLQLQSTIIGLQQSIEAKLQLEQARLDAERLKAQRETTNTSTIKTKPKERGHGFAR